MNRISSEVVEVKIYRKQQNTTMRKLSLTYCKSSHKMEVPPRRNISAIDRFVSISPTLQRVVIIPVTTDNFSIEFPSVEEP